MTLSLTDHAAIRMRQRAIPVAALDLLLDFGSTARGRGADSFFFDKKARRRLTAAFDAKELRGFQPYLNAYAVVADDGAIITVAHRIRRVRRA